MIFFIRQNYKNILLTLKLSVNIRTQGIKAGLANKINKQRTDPSSQGF